MKPYCHSLIILILVSCDFKSADYYYNEAVKMEEQDRFQEAIVLHTKAINRNDNFIPSYLNRGVDRFLLDDYEGAISDYSEIIKRDTNNTLAYLNRGKNKNRLADYHGAIGDYNSAIKTKGGEFFWMDKTPNGLVDIGSEYDCTMEEIRFERGIAYFNADSIHRALEDFQFCVERNLRTAESLYWRGLAYLNVAQKEHACKDFAESARLGDINAIELMEKYCSSVNKEKTISE